jgi:glutathione S-transferase
MTDCAQDSTLTTPPAEWTVLYHGSGNFKGRGEFLRLMLEDKCISFVESGENLYGPTGMMDCFRGSAQAVLEPQAVELPFPVFFPPGLWHRPGNGQEDVLINQVGAAMIYLGDQLGYAPSSSAERARATSVLLNALDYIAEGRRSFHPVENNMSYHNQKEEGDRESKIFSQTRMGIWLAHFEKTVQKFGGPETPVVGGKHITFADFALMHVLDATVSQFNTEFYDMAWDQQSVPALKKYLAWMKTRPNLQAYWKSDRNTGARIVDCFSYGLTLQASSQTGEHIPCCHNCTLDSHCFHFSPSFVLGMLHTLISLGWQ